MRVDPAPSSPRRDVPLEIAGMARHHSWMGWLLAYVLTAAGIVFFELGDCRTITSHEAYAVVPAREMLETGDWVVPRFGRQPRLKKPPLIYWSIATSAAIFGGVSEWSARLPAAVSAVLLAAVMGLWAHRWYGAVHGKIAGLAGLSSVYVLIFARKAEVDMLLCLLTTAALCLIALRPENEPRGRAFIRWVGVYALVSAAWLAKFHYGAAMVLGPAAISFILQRQWRALRQMANPVGLLLLAAAAIVWPYLVLQRVPHAGDIWWSETVGRAVGQLGRQPLWYYTPYFLWFPAPWTPFALATVPRSWKLAWSERDARERFLWICLLVQLAVLHISIDKHPNYLLAMMPLVSLLSTRGWIAWVEELKQHRQPLGRRVVWGYTAMIATAAVVTATVLVAKWPFAFVGLMLICAIAGCGGIAAVRLLSQRKVLPAGWIALAAFVAAFALANATVVPARDHRRRNADFALELRREVTGDRPVVLYQVLMDPAAYYLQSPILRADSPQQVAEYLRDRQELLVLTFAPLTPALEEFADVTTRRQLRPEDYPVPPRIPPLALLEVRWNAATAALLDRDTHRVAEQPGTQLR